MVETKVKKAVRELKALRISERQRAGRTEIKGCRCCRCCRCF